MAHDGEQVLGLAQALPASAAGGAEDAEGEEGAERQGGCQEVEHDASKGRGEGEGEGRRRRGRGEREGEEKERRKSRQRGVIHGGRREGDDGGAGQRGTGRMPFTVQYPSHDARCGRAGRRTRVQVSPSDRPHPVTMRGENGERRRPRLRPRMAGLRRASRKREGRCGQCVWWARGQRCDLRNRMQKD